ncbi:hypothetical protein QF026_004294 [Streptomyces aurantiacus]|uniref:HGxxPAAW family protein n=1 Tax=Streptomyces aurantiacus TaxID=47760 RepID=UPI002794FF18|nr:HGxxPAAW family protein [Streptomyces aurantiacus]MDQ0775828.1 hypothetical protein [Streptomyces aurantiacus]
MSGHQHDEGHTLAGWTGTSTAVVGASVAGVGMCLGSVAGIGLGLGVVGLSVLVTWGLHLIGWGKPSGIRPVAERGWRVRDRAARAGHPGCLGCRLAGRRASAAGAAKRGGEWGTATGTEYRRRCQCLPLRS